MMTIPRDQDSRAARIQIAQARNGSLELTRISRKLDAGERLLEGQIERGGRHSPSGL